MTTGQSPQTKETEDQVAEARAAETSPEKLQELEQAEIPNNPIETIIRSAILNVMAPPLPPGQPPIAFVQFITLAGHTFTVQLDEVGGIGLADGLYQVFGKTPVDTYGPDALRGLPRAP